MCNKKVLGTWPEYILNIAFKNTFSVEVVKTYPDWVYRPNTKWNVFNSTNFALSIRKNGTILRLDLPSNYNDNKTEWDYKH